MIAIIRSIHSEQRHAAGAITTAYIGPISAARPGASYTIPKQRSFAGGVTKVPKVATLSVSMPPPAPQRLNTVVSTVIGQPTVATAMGTLVPPASRGPPNPRTNLGLANIPRGTASSGGLPPPPSAHSSDSRLTNSHMMPLHQKTIKPPPGSATVISPGIMSMDHPVTRRLQTGPLLSPLGLITPLSPAMKSAILVSPSYPRLGLD